VAVGTGWGAAVYAAETRPGDVVIVMGIGGVGINAVQGAAHAGATTLIAVDPVDLKREVAMELGATHTFAAIEEADGFAKSITNGQGADRAIVTVDVLSGTHVAQAVAAIRKAGTAVVIAVAPSQYEGGIPHPSSGALAHAEADPRERCSASATLVRTFLARSRLYRAGQLKLDELVTRTYTLDEVVPAYEDMTAGRNIRGVIVFD